MPPMRVGCPNIHLLVKPTRVIQARRSDRNKLRERVGFAHDRRTAIGAETAARVAAHFTGGSVETE